MSIDRERVFFESSPTAMILLTPEGTVEDLNRAARKTLGVKPESLLGRPILLTVVPEDRDRVREFFLRVLQGQQREWMTRFTRGDAATRLQWVRAVPIERSGQAEGILMFTRDITEAREGRPETVQLQMLLENLPGQFTAVLDAQGRIRYSAGLARTHFRNDVDLIGTPLQELLEPGEEGNDVATILETTHEGGHWSGTQWHRRVDGTVFPIRTFASPYMDSRDGRVLGVLLVGRDVSSEYDWRNRAERSRRLAAIGELVGRIAAEVDSGLARIQASLGDGEDVAKACELLRMRSFARSLKSFTATGSGRRGRVVLDDAVREAVARLQGRITRIGASLSIEGADAATSVTGDRERLVTLVQVLLENALDSAEEGGDGVITLSVGSGMSGGVLRVANQLPETAEPAFHRLFEPMFSTRAGHAGLGLTIARSIAEEHGGRVWSEIDDARRVVFSVHLPEDATEPKSRFRAAPLVLSRTRSVLVVDDEHEVRSGIRRFLEKVGFEVREAWSGRSALAQITAGHPPELVLTDMRMSDGSGQWLLDELSRDFPDLLRRTVIITGDPEDYAVAEMVARTGCPVMAKPLELPELLELLEEVALRD